MSVNQQDWGLHRKGTADQERHLEKIKDALRKNLADIVSEENIISNQGDKTVKIPVKVMDDYHFRHGDPPAGEEHIGQGSGQSNNGKGVQPGDKVGRRNKPGQRGAGGGAAGGEPGEDYYEAEVEIADLAALIFEDLGLPRLKPVANKLIVSSDIEFSSITRKGPMSNLDKRRSLKENIKRMAITHQPVGSNWNTEDLRFRTWEPKEKTESNAVVLALMDVSGSMGPNEKYIARSFFFWMVNFLRTKYNRVSIRFIAHHATAREVTEEEFFHKGESGGTMASSAYQLAYEILQEYSPSSWNSYVFHFSDGDNFSIDNQDCLAWARRLKERCNQVGYGQISQPAIGSYQTTLYSVFEPLVGENFLRQYVADKRAVWPALHNFFHKELSE